MNLEVFSPDIVPLGSVDAFTALKWTERYGRCGDFELWCPATKENAELLKEDNLLWIGDTTAGIVEIIQKTLSQSGPEINIKGRLLEGYLSYRVMWNIYNAQDKYVSVVLREIIETNCINPLIPDRKLKYLKLNPLQITLGEKMSVQRTGSDVLATVEEISDSQGVGFGIEFYPTSKEMLFTVYKGVDRTESQTNVPPVVLSSETEDILSSTYFHNTSEYKTVALVAGAGEGVDRKRVIIGGEYSGISRRELYVDARDLQQTDEESNPMPEEDYNKLLTQRGLEYLADKKDIKSFDAVIKSFGDQQHVYGVDYKLGDLVTVSDSVINISVSARVTEVERVFDQNGQSLNLVFGYAQPTLNQKLKFLSSGG